MAGLEDVIRSSAPGGNIGKPLMIALGALLASGILFRGSGGGQQTASQPSQAAPNEGAGAGAAGGLLAGLGGLLHTLNQGGLNNQTSSWVGNGQNQPVPPNQLGSALGPDVIKTLAQRSGLSEDELTQQLSQALPGLVDKLTPNGRLPTLSELSRLTG